MHIHALDQIKAENLTATRPKRHRNNYVSYLAYNQSKILFKTGRFRVTYVSSKCVELAIDNAFKKKIRAIENSVLDIVMANKESWFSKKNITDEDIRDRFESNVRYNFLKLPVSKLVSVFDRNNEEQKITDIKNDFNVVGIVNLSSIVFTKDKCSINFEVVQMKYFPRVENKLAKLSQCLIDDDSDDDASVSEEKEGVSEEKEDPNISEEKEDPNVREEKVSDNEEKEDPNVREEKVNVSEEKVIISEENKDVGDSPLPEPGEHASENESKKSGNGGIFEFF